MYRQGWYYPDKKTVSPTVFAPKSKGLTIMETAGSDVESITGMIAGGAQVVIFTTGRGTPAGSPLAPVIKVISNTTAYHKMPEDFDVNAGQVIDGDKSLKEVGEEIFNLVVEVADGKQPRAEVNRQNMFAIRHDGYQWPLMQDICKKGL